MTTIVLSKPAAGDKELLFHLHELLFREEIDRIWGWDDERQREGFSKEWDMMNTRTIHVGGSLAGYVQTRPELDHIYLLNLALYPKFQGHGSGSLVIQRLQQEAAAMNIPLRLNVFKTNGRAHALYLRHGFIFTNEAATGFKLQWTPPVEKTNEAVISPAPALVIRRILPGEAELYRRVRLESLIESPAAFLSTYESSAARSVQSWISQADGSATGDDRATFLVLADGEPVGLASLYRDPDGAETGELVQVWISPSLRSGGVGKELMNAVCGWAVSHGFTGIHGEVMPGNPGAVRFYQKCGFSTYPGGGEKGMMLVKELRTKA